MNTFKFCLWITLLLFFYACSNSSQSGENVHAENASSENTQNSEKNEDSETKNGDAKELKDEGYKRYALKSGKIEYKMTGFQNGTQTLYFDQWGLRETKITKSTIETMGVKQEMDQLEILDGEWMYTIDMTRQTGLKGKNPIYQQIISNANTKDLGEIGIKMLEGMGGKKIGQEEFLNRTCDIWNIPTTKTKMWIWKNIPLKLEIEIPGMGYTSVATNIEENVSVSADTFEAPEGIELQDLEGAMEQINKL